jgi:hypothetical protein
MKRKYRVILGFEVDGRQYEHNDIVEFDRDTAAVYAYALIRVEEGGD